MGLQHSFQKAAAGRMGLSWQAGPRAKGEEAAGVLPLELGPDPGHQPRAGAGLAQRPEGRHGQLGD